MRHARTGRPGLRQPAYTDPPPGVMTGPPVGRPDSRSFVTIVTLYGSCRFTASPPRLAATEPVRDGQPGATPCRLRVCPPAPPAPAVAAHCDVRHSYVVSRDERKKNCLVKPMA